MSKQLRITLPFLLITVFLIRLFAADKLWVEKYYSTGIYPVVSKVLKYSLGWLPFSLGDILYGVLTATLLFKIAKLLVMLFKRKYNWQLFRHFYR